MAGRPLDRIASWRMIHGVTPDLMDTHYKQMYIYTRFGTHRVPSVLFSEERFVKMMEFRENYIKRLHTFLTERLPAGAAITIRIPTKPRSGIHAGTYDLGLAEYNRMVAETQARGPEAVAAAAADLVPIKSLTIYIRFPSIEPGSYDFFIGDISNPVNNGPPMPHYNTRVGANVSKIVFDTVNEMKEAASAAINVYKKNVVMPYVYRPPGPDNAGGAAYLAAKSKFNMNKAGGSRRKKRSARNRRTKRTKQYFS